jgi:predicted nucleic acid-binding protein
MNTAYYLDTNALYAYYRDDMRGLQQQPGYQHYATLQGTEVIQALAETDAVLYVSSLTTVELVGQILRHERGKQIKSKHIDAILQRMRQDIGNHGRHRFRLIPVTDAVFAAGQELMLKCARRHGHNCGLDTNDALHIAVAQSLPPPIKLVTSDGGKAKGEKLAKMKCACQCIGLDFFDPEIS